MKISSDTLSVLKNFSAINQSVLLRPGNTIRTISPQKTIMAQAEVADNIDGSAAIYDLSRFLATINLMKDAEVEFGEDRFNIASGGKRVSYTYAAESMIVTPPDREIKIPDPDAVVSVTWEDIDSVIRAAGVLGLGEIGFSSDGKTVTMSAVSMKNKSSDRYDVVVSEVETEPFSGMYIKTENLRLLPRDYTVSLSSKGMAHFKASDVQYWVAIESGK